MITVYCDGASGNSSGKKIGYAAVLIYKNKKKEKVFRVLYGAERAGTNNIAEMEAALLALEFYKKPRKLKIVSDSEYVVLGATIWSKKWKKNGWKKRR